ncbi:MAG: methyltransferase domain-containing protein [Vicinamibacterales bacterium]
MTVPPLSYLRFLARQGAADVHPGGVIATRELLHHLDPGSARSVLEIGCGTATTLTRIVSRWPVRIVGVDVLGDMLAVGRRRIGLAGADERATLIRADAVAGLPFTSATFDRVYSESALGFHRRADARGLLAEVARVLRPGGRFVCSEAVWSPDAPTAQVDALVGRATDDFGLPPASPDVRTASAWTALIADAGFAVDAWTHGGRPRPEASRGWSGSRAALASTVVSGVSRVAAASTPAWRRDRRRFRAKLAAYDESGLLQAWFFVCRRLE